ESAIEIASKDKESELNLSANVGTNHSGPSGTLYDHLSKGAEDTSSDSSSDSSLEIHRNKKLDNKSERHKTRQYRANVRARINEKISTAEWLNYIGACDAHRKLVDNWDEYLQSVMWCSPQPIDIAQLEATRKPKLSRTIRIRQNRQLA
ncbi:hypothetical protein, partial [Enterobacter cloacae complex sp. GF14B]|uniref:hypothetical protein n=1 Tax=Enterobacter cloacae complex sp. GF14B TaxID=2511982 RepID=UPI001CA4F69D